MDDLNIDSKMVVEKEIHTYCLLDIWSDMEMRRYSAACKAGCPSGTRRPPRAGWSTPRRRVKLRPRQPRPDR